MLATLKLNCYELKNVRVLFNIRLRYINLLQAMNRKSEAANVLAQTMNLLREFEMKSLCFEGDGLNGLLDIGGLTGRALNYVAKAQLDASNAGTTLDPCMFMEVLMFFSHCRRALQRRTEQIAETRNIAESVVL